MVKMNQKAIEEKFIKELELVAHKYAEDREALDSWADYYITASVEE